MSKEIVVLSAVRSAVGGFGGSLANMEPAELGGLVEEFHSCPRCGRTESRVAAS